MLWAYPWDVAGEGAASLADNVRRAGASGVSLAAAYHSGLLVTPRHPRHRVYFPEPGAVYFALSPTVRRRLPFAPRMSRLLETGDPLRALTQEAERRDLVVRAWFVCNHSTYLGAMHPDVAVQNAYGDVLVFALCPANERVQDYLAALLGDLTTNYAVEAVDLESVGFLGLPHGFHHEKDLAGLNPETAFLLSLCFCRACTARAQQAGIDVERARAAVRTMVDRALREGTGPTPGEPAAEVPPPDVWIEDPELRAYLELRRTVVNGLAGRLRASVRPGCLLNLIEWTPPAAWWLQGFDSGILAYIDRIIVCRYHRDPSQLAQLLNETRRQAPGVRLSGGTQIGYPTCTTPQDVRAQVAAVRASPADELQVYNYGLVTADRLQWLADALASVDEA